MLLGITTQNHDASMALVNGNQIVWAAHAERYTRIKNHSVLNIEMLNELRKYGEPREIVWFEKPWQKNLRRWYSGQRPYIVRPSAELKHLKLDKLPINYVSHHQSHAAAGYFTSGFDNASILVVDSIGEWDAVSIWEAKNNKLTKKFSKKYPDSIGLFYTAMTQYLGLKPNEEEYILMGMAAFGQPLYVEELRETFFSSWAPPDFKLKHNLHRGCRWWAPSDSTANKFDIAASVQKLTEEYLIKTIQFIGQKYSSENLVFGGGVALNCVANSLIARTGMFKNIWILPNPGDAGSAIGAVAAYTGQHLDWKGPFLGTDIKRSVDINSLINDLEQGQIVAIANGRAEFGPRALGNRSLLADPRGPDAKQKMNTIKHREQFRPFAPAILAEYAQEYFDMPVAASPYMQFVAQCRYPDYLPGICHVDNSSRVQTVEPADNSLFHQILTEWHRRTGCPILMNTSLNIKGEPLVNSRNDAERFSHIHGIRVY